MSPRGPAERQTIHSAMRVLYAGSIPVTRSKTVSISVASTSRCVTNRTRPAATTAPIPCCASCCTVTAGSATSASTMLVSGVVDPSSLAHASPGGRSRCASAWSSANRSIPRSAHPARPRPAPRPGVLPRRASCGPGAPRAMGGRRNRGEQRAHRRAEALAQAHLHRVGAGGQSVYGHAERDSGVPHARSVEVDHQSEVPLRGCDQRETHSDRSGTTVPPAKLCVFSIHNSVGSHA